MGPLSENGVSECSGTGTGTVLLARRDILIVVPAASCEADNNDWGDGGDLQAAEGC